jgi:indole-3-glycerol phosphate synthase
LGDFLDVLAKDAKATIATGYYEPAKSIMKTASLKTAIQTAKKRHKNAVICEVKAASPSKGTIREKFDPAKVAEAMVKGGAVGISVLIEPKHFEGSLTNFSMVREAVDLPILFKDFVISPLQLKCAAKIGANTVLLIQALFDRGYCSESIEEMITTAHSLGLEVLLETHNEKEFEAALRSQTDLVGINNRNLGTLNVDLNVTKSILKKKCQKVNLVVSESGIKTSLDIQLLRKSGADAFLVGSSIMVSDNIEAKVKELVQA